MNPRHLRWLSLGLILGAVASAQEARADVLFDQPPTIQDGFYYTWSSGYTDANYNYFATLDDFQLSQDSTVTGISWQGMYLDYDPATGTYGNGAPNTTSWYFGIYTASAASNFPFDLIMSTTVDSSDVDRVFAGTTTFGSATIDYYNFSAVLPSGFALQGGTTYYLTIFSLSAGSTNTFSWLSGYGDDETSYQYSSYDNATYTRELDRALTLTRQAVPEPGSLAMAAIGAIGIGCVARLRRR